MVLGYINNEARIFHVYVANRVQTIRDNTRPSQWHYVPTEENPADQCSRGLRADELVCSNWLTGPSFLWDKEIAHEDPTPVDLSTNDPEMKKVVIHATESGETVSILQRLERFSTWASAIRAITALQKVARNDRKNSPASEDDRLKSRLTIIR